MLPYVFGPYFIASSGRRPSPTSWRVGFLNSRLEVRASFASVAPRLTRDPANATSRAMSSDRFVASMVFTVATDRSGESRH
jgi:hypothetical protein